MPYKPSLLTGNKGEWGEIYVLLRLIGDGSLTPGDEHHEEVQIPKFPIKAVERKNDVRFEIEGENVLTLKDGAVIAASNKTKYSIAADQILDTLHKERGTFSVPNIEYIFIDNSINQLKASSHEKADLYLEVIDPRSTIPSIAGYSIKSYFGSPPTLLNASTSTNFVYKITGSLSENEIVEINRIDSSGKLKKRIAAILEAGCRFEFLDLTSEIFDFNLRMVDSRMPEILSVFLFESYLSDQKSISELVSTVRDINPLQVPYEMRGEFYEHKIKDLLLSIALGLQPGHYWNGSYQANAGYIVADERGKVVSYSLYNLSDFREYLFRNCKFDTPSMSRHKFGEIISKGTEFYFRLNSQIRFS